MKKKITRLVEIVKEENGDSPRVIIPDEKGDIILEIISSHKVKLIIETDEIDEVNELRMFIMEQLEDLITFLVGENYMRDTSDFNYRYNTNSLGGPIEFTVICTQTVF